MPFVSDTFTESSDTALSSHTPEVGGSWIAKWDTTTVDVLASEDRVAGTSDTSPGLYYNDADPATNEYDVEATARFVTGSNNGNPAIVGRALVSGSLRNYIFAYLSKQFSSAYLQEVQNGSVSEQGTWSSTFNFDQDYQLKLEIRDGTNLCKLFIDGTQRAQITADVITDKGKAGLSVRLRGRLDNFVATDAGGGGVTGTLAYTNSNDTSSASGSTTIVGTVSVTNANDTSSASGSTTITGTVSYTNLNDNSSASGSTTIIGTVSVTNANDTSTASGTVGGGVSGTVAYINLNDTSSASGFTTIVGTVSVTNNNDISTASGFIAVTGTSNTTNNNDICAASGTSGNNNAVRFTLSFSSRLSSFNLSIKKTTISSLSTPNIKLKLRNS